MALPVRRTTLMAGAIDDDCLTTEFKGAAAKNRRDLHPRIDEGYGPFGSVSLGKPACGNHRPGASLVASGARPSWSIPTVAQQLPGAVRDPQQLGFCAWQLSPHRSSPSCLHSYSRQRPARRSFSARGGHRWVARGLVSCIRLNPISLICVPSVALLGRGGVNNLAG